MQKRKNLDRVLSEVAERYTVEPADSVKEEVMIDFLKSAYAGRPAADNYRDKAQAIRRQQWLKLKNPNLNNEQSISWVARDRKSGALVGHFGIMPISLKYKESSYPAAWGIDLIVPRKFRKSGIASFLASSVLKNTKDKLGLFLLAGANDYVVSKVFKKVGFMHLGHIPLYVRVNRLGNILQKKMPLAILARFLSIIGEGALRLFYIPSYIRAFKYKKSGIVLTKIEKFDKSFDKLWEKASPGFPLATKRDSTTLNWRFVDQPCRKYRIFKAGDGLGGETKGYIVLRTGKSRGLNAGIISDLFARADDIRTIAALTNFAVKYFEKKSDIDLIRCDILHKGFSRVLKRLGFINIRSGSHFLAANASRGMDARFVADRANWFITYADSDLDL